MRSISDLAVNRRVGSIHVAKAIILFGARGSNTIEDIILAVHKAKQTSAHAQHVQEIHSPSPAVRRAREQYKKQRFCITRQRI